MQQLELPLNAVSNATPEEVRQWEQDDFFRAGKFNVMKLFVVYPATVQLLTIVMMFTIFWVNSKIV